LKEVDQGCIYLIKNTFKTNFGKYYYNLTNFLIYFNVIHDKAEFSAASTVFSITQSTQKHLLLLPMFKKVVRLNTKSCHKTDGTG